MPLLKWRPTSPPRCGSAIGVVSVVPVIPGVDLPPADGAAARKNLREAKKRLSSFDLRPKLHHAEGHPAIEIERVATEHGYDTIVVGGRELGMIGRLLLGSVSEHIATHARATVVIVRPGALVATTTGS